MIVTTGHFERRTFWKTWTSVDALRRPAFIALAAVVAIAITGMMVQGTGYAFRDRPANGRVDGVIATARAVQAVETEAEAAERGYVMTGDPSFITAIQTSVETLPGSAARLRRLVSHDPAQAGRAGTLEGLVARRTEHLMHVVELRRNVGARAASEYVLRADVRDLDRRIRGLLAQIIQAEQASLATN